MLPSDVKSTIGQPFIELTVVESTNIYAMDRLQANLAAHGSVFFAHHQTGGKGQHGKTWSDEPGTNIILSAIIDCSFLPLAKQFQLSMAVALACFDFFNKYVPDEFSIKWPNDLYWRDRKAGGILIENQIRGTQWQAAVVGIGLNINQTRFPESLKNPVSLQQITGKKFETSLLAHELCRFLETRYQQLRKGEFDVLLRDYNLHLYKAGETVRLKKENRAFYCRVQEVNPQGELLVSDGPQERFRFGEVEWMIS